MAKITYLELVEMLSDTLKGKDKEKLVHVLARKKALKEEDEDLNSILDGMLKELRGEQPDV